MDSTERDKWWHLNDPPHTTKPSRPNREAGMDVLLGSSTEEAGGEEAAVWRRAVQEQCRVACWLGSLAVISSPSTHPRIAGLWSLALGYWWTHYTMSVLVELLYGILWGHDWLPLATGFYAHRNQALEDRGQL